jgi:hypothetical protein
MTLTDLEQTIRAAWSPETADPVDRADWTPENPARGHCGVTSVLLQRLLGGELLVADVVHADGTRQGIHYWNRLAGGVEVDLTREQFISGEVVLDDTVRVAPRPERIEGSRVATEYRTLEARVRAALAA